MAVPREIPLTRVRGKANHIRGKAYRNNQPASLAGHYLQAAIADRNTSERVALVTSGDGITQDAQGVYEAIFSSSTMAELSNNEYWYEVEIWENEDEDRRYVLQHGVLSLRPSPF